MSENRTEQDPIDDDDERTLFMTLQASKTAAPTCQATNLTMEPIRSDGEIDSR